MQFAISRNILGHLILLMLLLPDSSKAQSGNYRFTHFDIEDGLSQNTVTDILHDSEGYLWFGTQEGLNRFDGYDFRHYKHNPNDSTSISDNYVWSIIEDAGGNIWMCTRNGVNMLDKRTGNFTSFTFYKSSTIGVVKLIENEVWITAYDGEVFRIDPGSVTKESSKELNDYLVTIINPDYGFALSIINHSRLDKVVYTSKGIVFLSEEKQRFIPFGFENFPLKNQASMMIESKNGELLVGSTKGIFVFNPVSNKLELYSKHFTSSNIQSLALGPKGNLWVATTEGITIIEKASGEPVNFLPIGENSETLSGEALHVIYKDRNNHIWVSAINKGVFKYEHELDYFKFLTEEHGLGPAPIWTIQQVNDNEYWIGTDAGVTVITLSDGFNFTSNTFAEENIQSIQQLNFEPIQNQRVNTVFVDFQNNRWIGTHGNGLFLLGPNNTLLKSFTFEQGSTHANQITSITQINHEYWITTFNGIFVIDENYRFKERFEKVDSITTYFFAGFKDLKNHLWFGSNIGLFRYNPSTDSLTHLTYNPDADQSPGFNFVNNILEAGNKELWLGTFGGGIDLFDPETITYQNFNEEDGLANNVVSSLEIDSNGNLWMGTNKGISRFDTQNHTFINFDNRNGIIFNEAAINASYKNKKGELFFGTADGLVIFHPDSVSTSVPLSKPTLTSFLINYEKERSISNEHGVTDIYPDDKVLSFEFATLNPKNPDQITYEFMIEGIDEHWIQTPASKRTATYSTLPYGENLFKVRARNMYGTLSGETTVLLDVQRPFWLTWWFLSFGVILFMSVAALSSRTFYKHRMRRKLQSLEIAEKVHEERERISRDLHDTIGSQLTHIISSLDNITYQEKLDNNDRSKLEDLSDFARTTMQSLRETIWVISKNVISIGEFTDRISDYCDKIADLEGIFISSRCESAGSYLLHPATSMNLLRITQEGVTNSIKHANASIIQVVIIEHESHISLKISDNGSGFDTAHSQDRYGIKNMEIRARELKGDFDIISSESGTTIEVTVPKLN